VWNGSSKISKNVLIKEYSEGGLKMIDIFSFIIALKCSWIRRLITGNGKWINIIKMTIDTQKLYNCGVHYPENLILKTENAFWKDTLKSFVDFRKSESLNIKYILQTPIFYVVDLEVKQANG